MTSAIGMLVMALYNVVDTFWVGGLPYGPPLLRDLAAAPGEGALQGAQAIAALTVVFPLQMIAAALGTGTAVGVASLVSRRYGEGRVEEVNDVGGHAVWLPITLGLLLMLASRGFPDLMLRAFGARADIVAIAHVYLTTVALGFPFLLFLMTTNGLFRGAGDTRTPMFIMGLSGGMNLVLDPFLIYGIGPFPRLEVHGAAVATVASQMIALVASAGYLWSRHSGFHVRLHNLRPRGSVLRGIYQVGAPAAAMQIVQSVVVSLFNQVLGHYGSVAIAAYGLTFRILMVIMPWLFGINQGLLPIVGFSFGARNYRRLWDAFAMAAKVGAAIGLVIASLLMVFAPDVVRLFTHDPELIRIATLSVRIILIGLVAMAPQFMGVAVLQGMGLGSEAMFVSLTRQVIFLIPALFLLSHWFGLVGAFVAMPVADVLSFAVTMAWLWRLHGRYRPESAADAPAEELPVL